MRQYIWIEDSSELTIIARSEDSKKVRKEVKAELSRLKDDKSISPAFYDRALNLATGKGNLTESITIADKNPSKVMIIFAKNMKTYKG